MAMKFGGLLLIVLTFGGCATTERTAVLKPFVSDGCSLYPEGPLGRSDVWRTPCVTHDRSYWQGGTWRERLEADWRFCREVAACSHPVDGLAMFLGVRFGGTPYLPTRWRWGYGWDYPRGYRALTEGEEEMVAANLAAQE